MKELSKKTLYLNPNITFVTNQEIVEYDMKSAGFSLIRKYNMLPDDMIDRLGKVGKKSNALDPKYGKKEQDILIGKLQRNDKELSKKMKLAYEIERENFITKNQLDEEDIISIKKDAFFLSTTKSIKGKIDDYIHFRKKNEYTSYIYIKPLEIYYKDGQELEIKGLSDESYDLHRDFLLSFIKRILKLAETRDKETVLMSARRFIDKYKALELESEYYREFNSQSKFQYLDGEMTDVDYRQDNQELNIMYNYQILIRLLSYLLR